jgi:branched-chain amino acid transport system ATP-binding protein
MSLKVENLSAGYGDIQVVRDISFEVAQGEIIALLGPNGAGKTTTLNAISGLIVTTRSGKILLNNQDISLKPAHQRVQAGIAQVPQGRQLFPFMSVRENLEMGAYIPENRAQMGTNINRMAGIFPILGERMNLNAGSLSGGEQQMCAIARGLMSNPSYLLLDEPSLGLAPIMVRQVMSVITDIAKKGIGVFLVEQNVVQGLKLARYAYVLEQSKIAFEGLSTALLEDDRVRRAYLGM